MAEQNDGRKGGKSNPPQIGAAPPTAGDDITPVATGAVDPVKPDPRDAELAELRAENARLKAAARPGGLYAAGRRYLVRLEGNPACVVEPKDGEHPYECYKAALGIVRSDAAPVIQETDLPLGRVKGAA
jgi:hypothetical protein